MNHVLVDVTDDADDLAAYNEPERALDPDLINPLAAFIRLRRALIDVQRLALQQPRHLAGQTGRLANEHALQRRRPIDQTEADIAHRAQQRATWFENKRLSELVASPIAIVSNRRQR